MFLLFSPTPEAAAAAAAAAAELDLFSLFFFFLDRDPEMIIEGGKKGKKMPPRRRRGGEFVCVVVYLSRLARLLRGPKSCRIAIYNQCLLPFRQNVCLAHGGGGKFEAGFPPLSLSS